MADVRTTTPVSRRSWLTLAAISLFGFTSACLSGANDGVDPPMDRLFFITGLNLEGASSTGASCDAQTSCPTGQACVQGQCRGPARYLVAANANSKREYNASTLAVFDLDRFFGATGIKGLSTAGSSEQIQPAGATPSAQLPCRRDAAQTRVVECEESFFALPDAGVALGVFAGAPTPFLQKGGERQLLVPVRGEPSITVVDVRGGEGTAPIQLSCAKDPQTRRCDAAHKLRAVRNSVDLGRLGMHPRSIVTYPSFEPPLAMLGHDSRPDLTLLGFEAPNATSAMILDRVPLLTQGPAGIGGNAAARAGTSALAIYPCRSAKDGGTPPLSTRNCTQPLVYASYRNRARVDMISVSDLKEQAKNKASCVRARKAGVSEFACGVGARTVDSFETGSLIPATNVPKDLFGASAFLPDGSFYFLVQREPGALLRFDSRIDARSQMPKNQFAGAIDVCAGASDLLLYSGQRNYALVSCRDAAQVYLVDLDAFVLIKSIDVGASPSGMVADAAREVIYIPNFMNSTVTVLDMSETRSTRHSVIARLGLREEVQ